MTGYPIKFENYYETPANAANIFGNLFPNLFFYPSMLATVFRSSRIGKAEKMTNEAWAQSSYEIFQALERVSCKFIIENLDAFSKLNEPCVVVGNHMSTLETFVIPAILQPHKDIAFVVKKSLADYPFFRWVIKATTPIIVGRTNPREDLRTVLEEGQKKLESGRSVVVFPQSTRSLQLDPAKFNSIGTKLAKRAGVPVVPLALKTDAWTIGRFIKDFGRVDPTKSIHFRFGSAMEVTGNGKEQHAKICEFISSALDEWS